MTLKKDINRLVDRDSGRTALRDPAAADAIPASVGVADFTKGAAFDPAGIVPPLTEQSRETKTLTITVPEGTTSIDVEVITQLTLTDSNDKELIMNFAEPES